MSEWESGSGIISRDLEDICHVLSHIYISIIIKSLILHMPVGRSGPLTLVPVFQDVDSSDSEYDEDLQDMEDENRKKEALQREEQVTKWQCPRENCTTILEPGVRGARWPVLKRDKFGKPWPIPPVAW